MVITIETSTSVGKQIISYITQRINDDLDAETILWREVDWYEVVNSYLSEYDAVGIIVGYQITHIKFNNDALYTYCLLKLDQNEP